VPGARRPPGGWGWYPLDDLWARRVVAAAAPRPGELVLDIGAGTGALTAHLVAAGARVVAVELHPGRAATLRRRFADADVTVVEADISALRLPRRPFRVVANPPYAGSGALLRLLLDRGSLMQAADLVLQGAVVRRVVDGDLRGLRRAGRFRVERGLSVPRRAFHPPPRVDSAVLVVRRR
jgi:23S rRNA (adenine-N6)-dimethyltransferase